jgi:hypothetical protein
MLVHEINPQLGGAIGCPANQGAAMPIGAAKAIASSTERALDFAGVLPLNRIG